MMYSLLARFPIVVTRCWTTSILTVMSETWQQWFILIELPANYICLASRVICRIIQRLYTLRKIFLFGIFIYAHRFAVSFHSMVKCSIQVQLLHSSLAGLHEESTHTLPTDQTIHNRIVSKVCCNVFTCGIRITHINQHNILLWITIRTIFNNMKPCYFIRFHNIII